MGKEVVSKFLNCEPDEGAIEPDKFVSFTYRSNKLVYGLALDLEEKIVSASADFNEPFGHACISEVVAEYDTITIEQEPEFYGDDEILTFKKSYSHRAGVPTLRLKMWKDGTLSIWMSRDINGETV